jgi:hypothetical protein
VDIDKISPFDLEDVVVSTVILVIREGCQEARGARTVCLVIIAIRAIVLRQEGIENVTD